MRALALLGLLATAACALDKGGLGADLSDAETPLHPGSSDEDDSAPPPADGATRDEAIDGAVVTLIDEGGGVDASQDSEGGLAPPAEGGQVEAGNEDGASTEAGSEMDSGFRSADASEGGEADATLGDAEAGTVGSTPDGGNDAASEDDATPPDAGPTCQSTIPSGWTLAIYDLGPDACPAGFGEHDVLGPATIASGACSCTCDVTQDGSCTEGTLSTFGDTLDANACGNPWFSVAITADSVCTTVPVTVPAVRPIPLSFEAAPLPAQGGTCATTSQSDPTAISTTPARYCDVPPASAEAVCDGIVPSGFAACIATPGETTCPTGGPFVHPFAVEDAATLQCSACGACTVSTTCSNAVVTIHSGAKCGDTGVALSVDGTCNPTDVSDTKTVAAVEYTADETTTCAAGSSTASAKLTNPVTMCCL